MVAHAIDFNAIRKALGNAIQNATGLISILEKPVIQGEQRPALPYFSFNFTTPAAKSGDDATRIKTTGSGDSQITTSTTMGVRKMVVSFNAYAVEKEDAYSLMSDWQAALEAISVQAALRSAGIAVWVIGGVEDLSPLLNTGYEGRAHLDCSFGIVATRAEVAGVIDTVEIAGQVTTDSGAVVDVDLTVTDDT